MNMYRNMCVHINISLSLSLSLFMYIRWCLPSKPGFSGKRWLTMHAQTYVA